MEKAVLYASCAPCERCLGAIASLGVHNVVCGVLYKEFCKLLPFDYQAVDREGLLKQLGITMKLTESVIVFIISTVIHIILFLLCIAYVYRFLDGENIYWLARYFLTGAEPPF